MENGITLFECEHNGRCPDEKIIPEIHTNSGKPGKWVDDDKAFVVHPDMRDALMDYHPDRNSFKDAFDARNKAVENGEVYWNTDHDDEMKSTAEERTKTPWWKK